MVLNYVLLYINPPLGIFIGLSPQSDFPFLGITPGHNSLAFKISILKRI